MKKNINLLFASAFIVLLSLTLSSCGKQNDNAYSAAHLSDFEISKDYDEALSILRKKYVDYEDAEKARHLLYVFSSRQTEKDSDKKRILNDNKYKDALVLYYYASAISNFNNLKMDKQVSCHSALSELSEIPPDYNGILADKINNFKNEVKTAKAENLKLRNASDEIDKIEQKTNIHLGDPGFKVLQILGEPIRKNKTTTQNGTREQWVYGNGTYIYLENGSVTSWQTSE